MSAVGYEQAIFYERSKEGSQIADLLPRLKVSYMEV